MKSLKDFIFKSLRPVARFYRWFAWVGGLQVLVTFAVPIAIPDIASAWVLLSLALAALWFTTYALLQLVVANAQRAEKGFRAWLGRQWEWLMFVAWIASTLATLLLILKVVNQL